VNGLGESCRRISKPMNTGGDRSNDVSGGGVVNSKNEYPARHSENWLGKIALIGIIKAGGRLNTREGGGQNMRMNTTMVTTISVEELKEGVHQLSGVCCQAIRVGEITKFGTGQSLWKSKQKNETWD